MRSEDLYKAIGEIGEDLLARSEQAAEGTAAENSAAGETQKIPVKKEENPAEKRKQAKKPVKLYWFRYAAAAAACILVFVGGVAVLRGWRAGSTGPQEVAEEKAVESVSASAEAEESYEEVFEEAAPEAEEETEAAPDEEAMMEDTAPAETTEAAPAAEEAPQQAANGAKDAGTGRSVDEDSWDDEPWERSDSAGAVLVSAALKESEESSLRAAFSEEAKSVLTAFEADSAAAILGEEEGENKLYSPLNLYTAMAMLAHVTCEEAQDELIRALGGNPPSFMTDPNWALFIICLLRVWQFGSAMVIFLAALKGVPTELYEAASIDGASKSRQFFSITLPLITPVVFYNLVTQLVQAFQEFNGPYIITRGGPLGSTTLMSLLIYNNAFTSYNMGKASAQAWVLFIILLVFTLIAFASQKYWVYYSDDEGGK